MTAIGSELPITDPPLRSTAHIALIGLKRGSKNVKAGVKRNLEAMKDSFSKGVDKYMGAISTRLGDINPKLKAKIRQLDFNIGTNQKEDVESVVGMLKNGMLRA